MGRVNLGGQSGQTATEMMLAIAVVCVSVVSAAYAFVPALQAGTNSLAADVAFILRTHEIPTRGVTDPEKKAETQANAKTSEPKRDKQREKYMRPHHRVEGGDIFHDTAMDLISGAGHHKGSAEVSCSLKSRWRREGCLSRLTAKEVERDFAVGVPDIMP